VIAMRTVLWVGLVLMAVACGNKDKAATIPIDNGQTGSGGNTGAGGDTGGGGDSGSGGTDTGDANVGDEGGACGGPMSCKPGEYCCDGSCGACAPIGTNCPLNPCPTDGAVPQ